MTRRCSNPWVGRWFLAAALTTVAVSPGCSVAHGPQPNGPRATGGTGPDPPARADVNLQRAFLTLAEIPPQPTPADVATRPAAVLSGRGARFLSRARELMAEQRYTEAAQAAEKALRSDPGAAEVHRMLARAALGAGSGERARAHAIEAVRIDATDAVSHYVLGRSAAEQGDHDITIQHCRTALACFEDRTPTEQAFAALTESCLARSLEASGYLTAATEAYRAYESRLSELRGEDPSRLPPEMIAQLRLGRRPVIDALTQLYERLGRSAEAAETWSAMLEVDPAPATPGVNAPAADVTIRLRFAELLAKAGRTAEALDQCRLAAEAVDEPARIIELLSEIRERAGTPSAVTEDVGAIVRSRRDDRRWLLAYVDLLRRFGHPERAERVLADYVTAHPDDSSAAWQLCDAYLESDRTIDAVQLAARVLQRDETEYSAALARMTALASREEPARTLLQGFHPHDVEEKYLVGSLALRSGRPRDGRRWLQEAVETAPGFAPARLALAGQHLAEHRWSAAIDLLGAVDDPDGNVERALGEAYVGLDDDETAARHFSAAIRLNRADSRALYALAQLYERTDRPLRARRQYETLVEIDPLHGPAREALVGLLVASRLTADAEAQVAELRRLAASPHLIARCDARIGLARGDIGVEVCRKTLAAMLETAGPDAETLIFVASLDLSRNAVDAAEAMLDRALAIDPDHVDARDLLTWVYRRQLRFADAIAETRALLERHPRRRRWIRNAVDLLMIEQDFAAAAEAASSFLQLGTLSGAALHEFRLALLQALEAAGRYDEQIAQVESWMRQSESDRKFRGWLLSAHLAAQRPAAALELARRWHVDDPLDERARTAYREVLVRTEHYTAAAQLALDAIADDPTNAALQVDLIDVLSEAERFDEALELAQSLVAVSPQPFRLLVRQLQLYDGAGRHDEAAALAARLIHDEDVQRGLGALDQATLRGQLSGALISSLIAGGRFDEAQGRLNRWIDQAATLGEKFDYLTLLAGVQQQRGLSAAALESLELAYSLNPADAGINNDLGYTLADAGTKLDDAERMVRFAVAREPLNAAYLDSLGWVLYRRGRFTDARRWIEKAAGAFGGLKDPVIFDHLADACWQAGDQDQAVQHWQEAVRLAQERLKEREDTVYRGVMESASAKLAAVGQGDAPPVAFVVEQAAPGTGPPDE